MTAARLGARPPDFRSQLQRKGRLNGVRGVYSPRCINTSKPRSIARRTSGGQTDSMRIFANRVAQRDSILHLTTARTDGGRWVLRQRSLAETSRTRRLRLLWKRVTLLKILRATLLPRFARWRQLSAPRSATPARLQPGQPRKKRSDHIIITLVPLSSKTSEQLALNSAPEDTYVTV